MFSRSFILWLAGLGWISFLFCWLLAQEEPTGSLKIRVVAEDTQKALAKVRVWRNRIGRERDSFYMTSNSQGWILRRKLPVGQYEITSAYGAGYQLEKIGPRFEILEGRETSLTLALSPLPSYLYFSVPQRQFTPQQDIQIDCSGRSRKNRLHLRLYKVKPLQYLWNASPEGYEGSSFGQEPGSIGLKEALKGANLVKDWNIPIKPSYSPEDPFAFQLSIPIPNLPRGLYVLLGNLGNLKTFTSLLRSNLGLMGKQTSDNLLLYCQRITDNQPQPNVQVYLFKGKKVQARGTTDARGLWEWAGPIGKTPLVFVQRREDIAWIQSSIPSSEGRNYHLYLFTERPVYRPGQKVFFKGIICSSANSRYKVARGQKVAVEIRDAQDSLVWKKDFTTSAMGSFWGSFPLGSEVGLGNWRLIGSIPGKTQETSFVVAEYRKPEYQINLTTDKKEYLRGEMIQVRGNARYYWGNPVTNAQVNYTVTVSDYWFYPEQEEVQEPYFPYEESRIYGQEVANGQLITDKKGNFHFSVPTQKEGIPLGEFQDQLFQITVEASDLAGRWVNQTIRCPVARGEIALFLNTANYIYGLGDQAQLSLQVTDLNRTSFSRPRKSLEGVPVEVWVDSPMVKRNQDLSIKDQLKGRLLFRVITDSEGKGQLRFPVDRPGEWVITATALDQKENKVSARLRLWVAEESFRDPGYSYPELALQGNKKAFLVGETAKILIHTSVQKRYALVSLEGPKIFWWKQIFLKGGSFLLQFPIKAEYLPNAYLSVCFAEGKQMVQQSIPIKVALDQHLLQVTVTSDKQEYQPGEKANFTITCQNTQGKPVLAEVSLGIADEAVYGVLEEQRPDIAQVLYGERDNLVQTLYSFPEIYYSGGAKEGGIGSQVRQWFPDTWKWLPSLITDQKGRVRLQLTVPDTLTTWRLTARAHTSSAAVGSALHKIRVRKSLMVRLITPRFLTQRDRTILSILLHDETLRPQKVKVQLKVEGLRLLSPPNSEITLTPGREEKIDYRVEADTTGTARLLASALADSGIRDAVRLSLPVLPYGVEKRKTFSGETERALTVHLPLPNSIIPEATKCDIRLSGSTAGVILQALDYLHSAAYGTSENAVGWFLPDMTVAMVFRDLNITFKELEAQLPERVVSNLQRLYRLQQEDGGWGWSDLAQSDAFWTAYVLYGLAQARKAGYSVDETRLQQGLQWLKDHLEKVRNESDRALVLYVMTFITASSPKGKKEEGNQQYRLRLKKECLTLARRLRSLSTKNYGLALLILALNQLRAREEAQGLAKVLEQRAKETSSECWWEETYPWGFYSCNLYETTGYALKALASVNPRNPKIAKAARWLITKRQSDGGWWNTEDTASVLYALADYLKAVQEKDPPNYLARVLMNYHPVQEIHVTPLNRWNSFEVLIPRSLLKRGSNLLRLEKQGKGKLFYNGVLRYWSVEDIRPVSQGLKITRQYFLWTRSPLGKEGQSEQLHPVRGSVKLGEEILVKITIEPQGDCKQVIINDPIPSGGEVIEGVTPEEERGVFSRKEVHDNRVTFYIDYLPKGKTELSYFLRAERQGEFHILPPQAGCLYIPEIWGIGEENRIRVR